MFLFQETYYATPGLQDLIAQRVQRLHEAQATQPSSLASDWMKWLGDGVTFMALRLWTDRNYAVDEEHMRWMGEYNRTRPADAFMQPPDIEFFEPVAQQGTPGGAQFCVRTELEVAGAGRASWASWEYELRAALLATPGFREYRLYQFLGRESRLFRTEFWETEAAGRAFWTVEDRRAQLGKLPPGTWRKAPLPTYYRVLHQLGDGRLQ